MFRSGTFVYAMRWFCTRYKWESPGHPRLRPSGSKAWGGREPLKMAEKKAISTWGWWAGAEKREDRCDPRAWYAIPKSWNGMACN
ncbi:hypothetical protein RSOLAG1IB_10736 [Rhizoctonia solani AG-1 IB]|uniref:Uncharacterized protein n=1 Tax=Thanatephorus cucumeris (strain AG1-IB / isolate 7/3/14) TaxID=1108050 RepID=A0A0B7G4L1_THACB|nr:hypothetical protein RSOLAG1IB_10736 [Rhizoctonia solani AG-1 IB]